MEADQNLEAPAVEAESPAPVQPACEEVGAPAPEPADPPAMPSDPEPTETTLPHGEEAKGASATPVNLPEGQGTGVAEEAPEKPPEDEVGEPQKEPERLADDKPEQKVELAAVSVAAPKEAEPTAKAPEPEPEKPAEEVKAETPKEAEPEKPAEEAEPQPKEAEPQPKEAEIPLFFGWLLLSEVEEKIKCSTMEFLKTLDTLESFKKHLSDFTGEAEKEVDLEQYFQTKLPLHCTAKFCDYGKADGWKEYSEQQVVKDACGSATEVSVVGLMVTPRTFGACVALTPEQLQLWPPGADKEGVPASALPSVEALPVGSRAHVTLGCAGGVEAVQTGLDLLEVLGLRQAGHPASATDELEAGTLSYLGEGRWYLELQEAIACDATFSSFSEDVRPTEQAKKEGGEKKRKPKCSIL